MNNLWYFCISIRLLLILFVKLYSKKFKTLIPIILLTIGLGFIYKGYTGSNNEIQISKVFWHETRYVHGTLYMLAYYYLSKHNLNTPLLLIKYSTLFFLLYINIFNPLFYYYYFFTLYNYYNIFKY